MTNYCFQMNEISLPELTQSEWAAWIQVAAAVIGIMLALYIPVRMKRLDDLERLQSALERINAMRALGDQYKSAMTSSASLHPVPREDFHTFIAASKSVINDPLTNAELLPVLAAASDTASEMLGHWERTAVGNDYRNEPGTVTYIGEVHTRMSTHAQKGAEVVKHFRRKHWFALLMHG